MSNIKTVPYDKSCFMWALTYKPNSRCKPHITQMYVNGNEAKREAYSINRRWKEQGMGENHWGVKRYMFRFRGEEIDAYEHSWERKEKHV